MDILIEVQCDTISELVAHLDKMKEQVLKQSRVNKVDLSATDFPEGTCLEDDNCYGSHSLNVIEYVRLKQKK